MIGWIDRAHGAGRCQAYSALILLQPNPEGTEANGRLRRLVVTAGSLALAAVTLAVPAQAAATSASSCPSGYLCGWSGTNETGSMMKARADMPTMGSWDNRIRSFWNRTSSFSSSGCGAEGGGARGCVR